MRRRTSTPPAAGSFWRRGEPSGGGRRGPVAYALTAALVFGGAAAGLWMSDQRVLGVLLPGLFVANLAVLKTMRLDTMTAAPTTR
ncbi:hypothetical protein LWP59_16060 [Amycolatopsis acidiphila]|uniref:Uncharacterized protein n=1 Tax=Amycolatopsis acidiphila TaxID=715473 RepID=A0A557ZXT4_9PSEU|nr:hypothetical protein [Amycolatopsis acidiphila]TVT16829.1 hypothetical protein FNH06_33795 [Amycolatopsis acidiphila]UIJ63031.1 hypothetical protein LWP59_16060 [Amycolatopsis acidiphila]